MMLKRLALLAGLALAPLGASAETDATGGYWLTENGKAIIQLAPCGVKVCGTMVWVADPRDDSGDLKRDLKNVDVAQRDRAICGLTLIGGLDEGTGGRFEDGWIYNPRDGETYSAEVELVSATELKVRGFLGISLLGSSQIWTRVADDRGGC